MTPLFKIATWNVNSLRVRMPHLLNWLNEEKIDVVALQETKTEDEKFPENTLTALGYHVVFHGQKTYNGVALLARQTISDVVNAHVAVEDMQCRVLAATINDIRVINLYVPNGSSIDSDKYVYKLGWLAKLKKYLAQQLQQYPRVVVLGDFNIAPDDRDVYDPISWQGQVLVSDPERQAWQEILQLGFTDSFRIFNPEAGHYSWWDYRLASWRRNLGLRIDHILISEALVKECHSCHIDKVPRGWERPSDHTPVVASFLGR